MVKIYIPQRAKQGIGGGWTFTANIQKVLKDKVEFVNNLEECDIYFIPGCTLAQREEVQKAKEKGKKIVLRVDNVPRNSRNRNTGTSRLFDFSQVADVVIYQSEWAKRWISPFIKRDGSVILNGADTDIFNWGGDIKEPEGEPQYLYSRFSRDETKRWEKVWYDFQRIYYDNPQAHLWIVGRFSDANKEYNFDFFGGAEKRYTYLGVITDREEMANIYRGADFLFMPYMIDACSNTLIEAMFCGTNILYSGDEDNGVYEVLHVNRDELTLESMGMKYYEVFKKLLK